jgi:hypothetical protein
MSRPKSTRRFAAFLERSGIYLVEYQKVRDRMDVLNRTDSPGDFRTAQDAAAALASLIRGQNGDGSTVSLTIRGLGTSHHILVLPQAKTDLLRPVVAREMQRLYSELEDPVVDFVSGEPVDRRTRARPDSGTPPQEILAAAMPRATMNEITTELARNSINIDHVTVLPRVMQRIYAEVTSQDAPTAVLMLLNGGPVFGFFYDRQLRLVVEPPGEGPDGTLSAAFVIEQLERGNLYLRQQFRGALISRLMLAAEASEYGPLSRAVEESMGLVVERFGPQIGSAGAIAAMGAVLDAQAGDGLNLFPVRETKQKSAQRATRRIAVAGAVLLGIIAWWWAGSGVLTVKTWRTRIATLTTALDSRAGPLQPMKEIIRKRQQSAAQLNAVQKVAAERAKLQQLLQSLSLAAEAEVTITSFSATRDPANWTVSISGNASAYAPSDAVSSVHRFYRGIPQMVRSSTVSLDGLNWPEPVASTQATTISFALHYTTPPSDDATSTPSVPPPQP